MKVTVTTRHLSNNQDPDRLKSYAAKKAKSIEKYLKDEIDSCEVKFVLWSEKFRDTAEISRPQAPSKLRICIPLLTVRST